MRTLLSITLAVTCALAAPMASAKSLGQIAAGTGLSPADFTMMGAATESLYVTTAPKTGTETTWDNAATGASGVVKIVDVTGNCVQLEHLVKPGATAPTRKIDTRRCKSADGTWLLQAD